MSRMSTSGRRRMRRVRHARSNGSPCVRRDRRSVRRTSKTVPFAAGRVRRTRSSGTAMVRLRINDAIRWRSSSSRWANDFWRSTSTALATIRIAVSSSPSSGSSSPAPRHDDAVCPVRTSAPSAPSSHSGSTPGGRFSSTRSSGSSSSREPSERYQSSNAASKASRSARLAIIVVRPAQ